MEHQDRVLSRIVKPLESVLGDGTHLTRRLGLFDNRLALVEIQQPPGEPRRVSDLNHSARSDERGVQALMTLIDDLAAGQVTDNRTGAWLYHQLLPDSLSYRLREAVKEDEREARRVAFDG